MTQTATLHDDRLVDLRDIQTDIRDAVGIELIAHLRHDASLQLVSPGSPIEIKRYVQAVFGAEFAWRCLQTGPQVWRAQITRLGQQGESHLRPAQAPAIQ